jgi:hypothetical protein
MSVSGIVAHAKHRLSSSTIEIADRTNNDNKTSLSSFVLFFFC